MNADRIATMTPMPKLPVANRIAPMYSRIPERSTVVTVPSSMGISLPGRFHSV